MDANNKITFTTIEGLKRHAIALKRETGCKHNAALEFVAKLGGYTNYQHAFRALSGR